MFHRSLEDRAVMREGGPRRNDRKEREREREEEGRRRRWLRG
jgi:hypothetical protein